MNQPILKNVLVNVDHLPIKIGYIARVQSEYRAIKKIAENQILVCGIEKFLKGFDQTDFLDHLGSI